MPRGYSSDNIPKKPGDIETCVTLADRIQDPLVSKLLFVSSRFNYIPALPLFDSSNRRLSGLEIRLLLLSVLARDPGQVQKYRVRVRTWALRFYLLSLQVYKVYI
ncbi:hypothetical protein IMY05_012G0060100 [Salix suchowensis]|nr:hypothetical protein IMY05_012G0060100 [Salix suchowensis]